MDEALTVGEPYFDESKHAPRFTHRWPAKVRPRQRRQPLPARSQGEQLPVRWMRGALARV